MNLVYDNRKQEPKSNDSKDGVLKKWLMLNSQETIKHFTELEKYDFKKPVKINSNYTLINYLQFGLRESICVHIIKYSQNRFIISVHKTKDQLYY